MVTEKVKNAKPSKTSEEKAEPVTPKVVKVEAQKEIEPVAKSVEATPRVLPNIIPFEVWFNLRKKKITAFRAMMVFAKKRSPSMLHTLEDWDKLFERF